MLSDSVIAFLSDCCDTVALRWVKNQKVSALSVTDSIFWKMKEENKYLDQILLPFVQGFPIIYYIPLAISCCALLLHWLVMPVNKFLVQTKNRRACKS